MHVHQSIQKDGKPLFAGDKYAGLSDIALYYIGGIIKHAKAINAFTNASTNSYKRLVPVSKRRSCSRTRRATARHRSVFRGSRTRRAGASKCASRIPRPTVPGLAAMLMAGIDGIQNKIHPGEPADKDLYDLPPEEARTSRKCATRWNRRWKRSTRIAAS
jgi:glutamine synthetase